MKEEHKEIIDRFLERVAKEEALKKQNIRKNTWWKIKRFFKGF